MAMADDSQDTAERTPGRLEGRVEELSAQQQQLNLRIDQLASEMTAGFQQVNGRIDQLNGHINKLMVAIIGFGGGMLAAPIGILFTLLLRGVPPA